MNIKVAESESHNRILGKLTRYTREEILAKIAEIEAVEQAYGEIVDVAAQLVDPYLYLDMVFLEHTPEPIKKLHAILTSCIYRYPDFHGGNLKRGSSELYPISEWDKGIRKVKSMTEQIEKALETARKG